MNLNLDVGHLYVFLIQVFRNNFKDDLLLVFWDGLLGDMLDKLAELHAVSLLEFGRREERCVQETNARAKHTDAETSCLKVVKKLLQCDIIDLESIPDLIESDLAVGALVLNLRAGNRLTKSKERQRQVDKSVLVLLNIRLAVNNLEQLQDHQSSDQGRSGGNCRDDLAGNELGLVAVCRLNLVILSTQVAASSDKVDMMVRVIILLEVYWSELEARERVRRRDTGNDLI